MSFLHHTFLDLVRMYIVQLPPRACFCQCLSSLSVWLHAHPSKIWQNWQWEGDKDFHGQLQEFDAWEKLSPLTWSTLRGSYNDVSDDLSYSAILGPRHNITKTYIYSGPKAPKEKTCQDQMLKSHFELTPRTTVQRRYTKLSSILFFKGTFHWLKVYKSTYQNAATNNNSHAYLNTLTMTIALLTAGVLGSSILTSDTVCVTRDIGIDESTRSHIAKCYFEASFMHIYHLFRSCNIDTITWNLDIPLTL